MYTYSDDYPVIIKENGQLKVPYAVEGIKVDSEDAPSIQYRYKTINVNVSRGLSNKKRILETAKDVIAKELNNNLQAYILGYYDIGTQIQFHSIYQRVKSEKIKDRIKSVGSWVDSVLAYYYSKKTEILSAQDEKALIAISWDYYTFNSTKPDVSLGGLFV